MQVIDYCSLPKMKISSLSLQSISCELQVWDIFTFFCIYKKGKYWIRKNFKLLVFDLFKRFGMFGKEIDNLLRNDCLFMCVSVCQKFCGFRNSRTNAWFSWNLTASWYKLVRIRFWYISLKKVMLSSFHNLYIW